MYACVEIRFVSMARASAEVNDEKGGNGVPDDFADGKILTYPFAIC